MDCYIEINHSTVLSHVNIIIATSDGNVHRVYFLKNKCEALFSSADDVVAGIDTHKERYIPPF